MTLRLILMRHAKSSWDASDVSDHERPLNARGRRSCIAIGEWLNEKGYVPQQVLCSTAVRTQETWELLGRELPEPTRPVLYRGLYLASAGMILDVLSNARGKSVALLAHNPGIAEFAARILRKPPAHPRFQDFPTLSTLVVNFEAEKWSGITWGSGEPVNFIVPRDLTD